MRAIRDTMPCTLQFFFFGVNAFGWAVEGDETEGCANCQISPVETMGGIVHLSSARYERAVRPFYEITCVPALQTLNPGNPAHEVEGLKLEAFKLRQLRIRICSCRTMV
jgi:hypothetical protein